MKILIIEDSDYKSSAIQAVLRELGIAEVIEVARSFHGGVRRLKELQPELTILDMTLPTNERPDGELEGRARILGGRDLLGEIAFEDIRTKVIIVTQFDTFPGTDKNIDLKSLLEQLRKSYPQILVGGIYYSNVDSAWQGELRQMCLELVETH